MPKGKDCDSLYPTRKLADHNPAHRKCLGPCGKVFASRGPGHRICVKCEARNSKVFLSKGERR